ncbi:MAG TPA: FHA domain-containing protein [Polyangiaceae bacterium]|jgi:hypothetical protein|nr:FHA domain-containing protein [Polyangiaceae bacterium]
MAELRAWNGAVRLLLSQHLVGRASECALRLSGSYVSAQHALLRWQDRSWELVDRGSRNGTRLDGVALVPGRPYRLAKGATITFGHPDERWTVDDVSAPQPMVVELESGDALLASHGLLAMPSSAAPECTLFLDVDELWKVETQDGSVRPLHDGETLECASKRYRFCAAHFSEATASVLQTTGSDEPGLRFSVSSDEEFVELTLEYESRRIALGSRAHNYLLLTLARTYLDDSAAGTPPESSGWMDKEELADGLRMTPQQVDGEVFRIRKHFAQHGLKEAATIIERRARTKQVRLGIRRVTIDRR